MGTGPANIYIRAMEPFKRPLRGLLRMAVRAFPVRGRYRLVKAVGPWIAPPPNEIFRLNGVNMELDPAIFSHLAIYYGLYEEPLVNFLKRHLRQGDIVLDPGANIGYISAVCLGLVAPTGHVHSFEPSPTANARIRACNNMAEQGNWSLWDAALTDHEGQEVFNDTPRVMRSGYAALASVATPKDSMPHRVSVTSIDAFCAQHNIGHVRFLKLDIEGSELPALQGASDMIANGAIDIIMVETNKTEGVHRKRTEAIGSLLHQAGYSSYHVRTNGSIRPLDVLKDMPYREDVIWMR